MAHPWKLTLFALLSVADLALTWWLLRHPDGQVYEANPVARWWLARHGWGGLALFKAGAVLLVAGLAAVISRQRPQTGGRLLALGCAAVAVVVFHSASLCREVRGRAQARQADEDWWADLERRTDARFRQGEVYRFLLKELAEGLIAGRHTLGEAVARLTASERGQDPAHLRDLARLYPGRPTEQCFAAQLLQYVRIARLEDPRAEGALRRLEGDFQLAYGGPPPRLHGVALEGTSTAEVARPAPYRRWRGGRPDGPPRPWGTRAR